MSVAPQHRWANPPSLQQARLRLGLTPDDVEAQSKKRGFGYEPLASADVDQWEAGESEPNLENLEALARLYVCPVGCFFLDRIPEESLKLDFRGVSEEGAIGGPGRQTLARFLEFVDWTDEVAKELGERVATDIGHASIADDLEGLVRSERTRLGFSPTVRRTWTNRDEAFDWWRSAIEGLGVFCFMMRLPTRQVRGASTWSEGGGAFILVNSEDAEAAAGRTFTLLHEYGHLLLRESFVCDFRGSTQGSKIEQFANAFAARMLIDRPELQTRLEELEMNHFRPTWGDSLLDKIRLPFFVSRDVVAILIEELDLAPEGFYRQKRAQWAKYKGFARASQPPRGRPLVQRKLRQVGSTFARLLAKSNGIDAVPLLDVAEMLGVKVERLPELFATFEEAGATR